MEVKFLRKAECDRCESDVITKTPHQTSPQFELENKGWHYRYIPFRSKTLCPTHNPWFKLTAHDIQYMSDMTPVQCLDCVHMADLCIATRFHRFKRAEHYTFCRHTGTRAFHNKRCVDYKQEDSI